EPVRGGPRRPECASAHPSAAQVVPTRQATRRRTYTGRVGRSGTPAGRAAPTHRRGRRPWKFRRTRVPNAQPAGGGAGPAWGPRLRVLGCNMHYAKVDPGPLDRLVEEARPDVVAVQEWRDSARSEVFLGDGWHTHRVRGLFLASRHPIRRADRLGDDSTGERG